MSVRVRWRLALAVTVLPLGLAVTGCSTAQSVVPRTRQSVTQTGKQSITHTSKLAVASAPSLKGAGALDAVYFDTATQGWIAGARAIYHTANAGRNWTRQYNGSGTIAQLDFAPGSGQGVAVVKDQFLLVTNNNGAAWTKVPFAAEQVTLVNSGCGYALARGKLYQTTNGGRHWHILNTRRSFTSISFLSNSTGYAANGPALYETSDGGHAWNRVFLAPVRKGASGPWQSLVQTSRSGAVWFMVYGGSDGMSQVGYVVFTSANGRVWKPMLEEGYWSPSYPTVHIPGYRGLGAQPGPFATVPIDFAGFVGWMPGAHVDKLQFTSTSDGGATWRTHAIANTRNPHAPTFWLPLSLYFSDQTHGWLVGSSRQGRGIVLRTVDGGREWTYLG